MRDFIKIEPEPLLEATAEVRFERKKGVLAETLVSRVQNICDDLGAIKPAEPLIASFIPAQVRDADPNLRDQPLYRFWLDETTVVIIGARVIGIGSIANYPGWTVFSKKLGELFSRFLDNNLIAHIARIGLRYVDHFNGDFINAEHSNIVATINRDDASARNVVLQTVLSCENNFLAQVVLANNSRVANPQRKDIVGSLMDTDVFRRYDEPMPVETDTAQKIADLFKQAHKNSKRLILDIVSEGYLTENGYQIYWKEQ